MHDIISTIKMCREFNVSLHLDGYTEMDLRLALMAIAYEAMWNKKDNHLIIIYNGISQTIQSDGQHRRAGRPGQDRRLVYADCIRGTIDIPF